MIVDQAEELITQNAKAAADFLTSIDRALGQGTGRLRVLVTVRSEFEPQFAQSALSARWPAARYLVPQMTQDELRRVIEGPAAVKVLRFESDDLIDLLINEVGQMPGALPLLSFALSEMYRNFVSRRGDDRSLTRVDYEALQGGVSGSLRVRANQILDELGRSHEGTARRVLERMVSVEAGEFARRRVPRREFTTADRDENRRTEDVLQRLIDARLVVVDAVNNDPYLELAHDALILGWDRLLTWVLEDAERIIALRRLTSDAFKWVHSPKANKGLLWDDPVRLADVRALLTRGFPGLNQVESAFAQASEKRERRTRSYGLP